MGGQRRVQVLMAIALAAAGGGASCGGTSRASGDAGRDAGDAGREDGGNAAQCPPPGAMVVEPPPQQIAFDGGVPIDQLAHALAVARCDYLTRCFALSTYVANECVESVEASESWAYQKCGTNVLGFFCYWTGLYYDYPSTDLLQAVESGMIRYDPQKQAQCLAALLTEGCAGGTLLEQIPACTGVFTCAAGADGGGPTVGGADGGSACAQLIPSSSLPIRTCSSDQDCAGVTQVPQGPYCVAGVCAASLCGIGIYFCPAYSAAGEPCNANANSPLNALEPTTPGGTCAAGLACQGQTADGGLGTCVVPQEVGGACSDDTNCKPGLSCACGACEIPPSTGPCVNGMCEIGVAYCDLGTNVCRPVRPSGANCADAINSCGPGLTCNGSGICG